MACHYQDMPDMAGEARAKHSGRQVKLTHMIIDNVEYEVID